MKKSVKASPELLNLAWHADGRLMIEAGDPRLLLLVGEPGTGKSTFARDAALRYTGRPPVVLSGTPETEEAHFFGRWGLAGGETRFCDGPLPVALKTGAWLVIEEFSQVLLDARAALLPLRDQASITNPLTGEVLEIPADFRLVATSNPEAMTCRRNTGIARVLYDGFFILDVPELTDHQVHRFLTHNFPTAPADRVGRVVELWQEYRGLSGADGESKPRLSYRAAAHLLALLERGMSEHKAVSAALVNKFMAIDPDVYEAARLKNNVA